MYTKNGKVKPLWRNVIVISAIAALFTAIYKTMDNITMHNFIVADDGLTAAFAYLVIGGWIGVASGLCFAKLFGRRLIDPDFHGFVLRNKKMHIQAFVSGGISAGSTLFLLWGNQLGDPSMMIALAGGTIFYTILYDVITKQTTTNVIAIPAAVVILGSVLATFGGPLEVTFFGVLFVLIISNGLSALSEIVEQKGVRVSDSVNLFVWRFFWLATTGTFLALSVTLARGKTPLLMETLAKAVDYLPWIGVTMFFVFLGVGLKLYAKKDNAISLVLLIISIQLIISYPITIIGNVIRPGLFGVVPSELGIWIVRMLGGAMMVWGILFVTNRISNKGE
jgi:hypothetical protein